MEFTKLTEIGVASATENTHVIAEVDGVLKRVPKKEVGGGTSGAGGCLITLTEDNVMEMNPSESSTTVACLLDDATMDQLFNTVITGGHVSVDMTMYMVEEEERLINKVFVSPNMFNTMEMDGNAKGIYALAVMVEGSIIPVIFVFLNAAAAESM